MDVTVLRRRSVGVLLALGALAACESGTGPAAEPVPMGQEFTLAVGQSAAIEGTGLVVTFREVVSESRCPSNALILCVWEGDAEVAVRLTGDERPAELILHTNDQFPTARSYDGVQVRLVRLEPYPETVDPIPVEQYRLTLVVDPLPG